METQTPTKTAFTTLDDLFCTWNDYCVEMATDYLEDMTAYVYDDDLKAEMRIVVDAVRDFEELLVERLASARAEYFGTGDTCE